MPTLEWIGKDKVVNHHQQVPYRVLEEKYTYNAEKSDNMIIRGDNLEALKALLPKYEGKVKCIYIDPPYNTGNEGWVYNDNVNDPKIKKWLGEVVGKEGEDLSRHDKWLCMMYPRLKILHRLLADDGVIFISISDVEHTHLRMICDEIFGRTNLVANVIWENNYSPRNDAKGITYATDNVLAYSKNPNWEPKRLGRTDSMDARYSTPDRDPVPWTSSPAHAPGARTHKGMVYAIQHPYTGELFYPPADRHWALEQAKVFAIMQEWADYKLEAIDDADIRAQICGESTIENIPDVMAVLLNEPLESAQKKAVERYNAGCWPTYYFTSKGRGGMRVKTHLDENEGKTVTTLWPYDEVGTNTEAKNEIKKLFDGAVPFDTPKPVRLLERILQIATDPDSIILDSFAGSGTTAHAVLNMNKVGGNRKFILIEMMEYADSITAERVKRVIDGYAQDQEIVLFDEEITVSNLEQGAELLAEAKAVVKEAKSKYSSVKKPTMDGNHLKVVAVNKAKDAVPGTGGSFTFYDLGEALLLPNGNLNENVSVDKIREYVYYMETKESMVGVSNGNPYFMGNSRDTAYYFYYEKDTITTLDHDFLATIPERADSYIIYADLCTIPAEELAKYNITFKKIPRDIAKL